MFESFDDLMSRLKATGYFIDPVMTRIVFLAAKLQKPLLLEGPAGSGKTQPVETGVLSKMTRPGKLSRARLEIPTCMVRLVPVWRARLRLM